MFFIPSAGDADAVRSTGVMASVGTTSSGIPEIMSSASQAGPLSLGMATADSGRRERTILLQKP